MSVEARARARAFLFRWLVSWLPRYFQHVQRVHSHSDDHPFLPRKKIEVPVRTGLLSGKLKGAASTLQNGRGHLEPQYIDHRASTIPSFFAPHVQLWIWKQMYAVLAQCVCVSVTRCWHTKFPFTQELKTARAIHTDHPKLHDQLYPPWRPEWLTMLDLTNHLWFGFWNEDRKK